MVESYMVRYEDVKPLPLEHREDFAKNLARIMLGRGGLPTSGWCLFRATFSPGGFHADHIHTKCDELVYIMSGHGIWGTAGKVYKIEPGCAFCVPKGLPHWMKNTHPTENIEVVGFYPEVTHFDDTGYKYLGPIPADAAVNAAGWQG